MKEIAKAIQEGAMAYLKRQFKTIGVILVPLAVIVFVTSTKVKTDGLNARAEPRRVVVRAVGRASAPARSCSAASCRASPASSA